MKVFTKLPEKEKNEDREVEGLFDESIPMNLQIHL